MIQLDNLRKWMQETNIDVAYISDFTNINYYTGYGEDPEERVLALFVFKDSDPFLFTPALSVEEAKASGFKYDVYGYLDHENPFEKIAELIKSRTNNFANWAIEKDNLTVSRFQELHRLFPLASLTQDLSKYIESARLIKSEDELELMKKAGQDADFAFEVAFKTIAEEPGLTEQELVNKIESALTAKGVVGVSFPTLVQVGANAANPHGDATTTEITPNNLILMDLGTIFNGYISDATRTVAYGEPTDLQKEIYEVCLKANLEAMKAAEPGITAAELDKVARDIIDEAGFGEYFIHRLGHGLGKSVHEFPSIMEGNDLVLEKGMCFSIEPGIYIPGKAGVRIEDSGYLTDTGFEPFTHTSKELKIIPAK